ncbi:hypothetical protein S7711_04486 [Stachybotrys chartarum IBT 7711]|uniref:Uncharacterized protein n=1 Tax=Stachybotrys chartarum (strain CBS 109288 / IBT 7711) TaxID=1280523 RepID=A0A084BA69_STACB|nr:hypothetical protein S7711_04486 [Stachybotrys chartarum IBT 7711]
METTNFKRAKRRSAKPRSNIDPSHPRTDAHAFMEASTDRHAKPGAPVVGVATEPYVVTLARQHDFATVQKMESEQGPESVVRAFMTSTHDSEACVPAADSVCAMFPGTGLATLEEEDSALNEKIALLIEASLHEGRTTVEDDLGPLSATDLSRLHTIPDSAFTRSIMRSPVTSVDTGRKTRRRKRKTTLDEARLTNVYASEPSEDPRRFYNSRPLRDTTELTQMDRMTPQGQRSFLYEAEISCIITSPHDHHWAGWCFVDTYYAAKADVRESCVYYYEESLGSEGVRSDPFLYGTKTVHEPLWSAAEFFLNFVWVRMRQAKTHWHQVVNMVGCNTYLGDNNYTPPTAELRDFRDGIKSWARLSKKLSRQLSTIAATNDKFLNSTADHFKGLAKYLSSIRGIIDDLEADSRKLADQASEWESLLHNLEIEYTSEAQELGNSQKRIADDSRYLSYLLIFWATPLALTLATLTLDTSFIPFVPRRSSFIIVLFLVYSSMSIVVLRGIRNYDYIAALSDALLGRKSWKPSDGWVTLQWARSRQQRPSDTPLEGQEELHVHAGEVLT